MTQTADDDEEEDKAAAGPSVAATPGLLANLRNLVSKSEDSENERGTKRHRPSKPLFVCNCVFCVTDSFVQIANLCFLSFADEW